MILFLAQPGAGRERKGTVQYSRGWKESDTQSQSFVSFVVFCCLERVFGLVSLRIRSHIVYAPCLLLYF